MMTVRVLCLWLAGAGIALAQSQFVSDRLQLGLHEAASISSPILELIGSGTEAARPGPTIATGGSLEVGVFSTSSQSSRENGSSPISVGMSSAATTLSTGAGRMPSPTSWLGTVGVAVAPLSPATVPVTCVPW